MTTREPVRRGRHFLVRDGQPYVPVGAHLVPSSGPDWPWRVGIEEFDRELAAMAAAGLDTVRVDLVWAALEPRPGELAEDHLGVLDSLLEAADRHGLTLHPVLFVGGEVGDAVWEPEWVGGRNPHRDEELLDLQVRQASALGRRWAGHPTLLAWDLSDEPPHWLHKDSTTDDDARGWTRLLASALRETDPAHLITVGTASQEVDGAPFRSDVVSAELDFACVHPYPIYSPELYPDDLLSPRMTHAAAFETALAAGAGKPVMVHEYGASSVQFTPEQIAAYDRLLVWSAFGRGAIGFYAWCWTDAEPAAYGRAPYVRMPHELQFGLTEHTGVPRPRLASTADLARTLRTLPLDGLAGDGPVVDAGIMVPFEYASPYDERAYGLEAEPSGPYLPAERAWDPERDVKPLVRAWLNAFVLASRAGISAGFPREGLDHAWPDLPLLLLPAPLTTTTSSLLHLRTSFWAGAGDFHARGGTVYLSLSAESAVPDAERLAGIRLAGRAAVRDRVVLTVVAPFGGLVPGDTIVLPAGSADLHLRGARIEPTDAVVVAVDPDGAPAVTLAARGRGHTVVCAYPAELLLAAQPDAHAATDSSWRLYDAVRRVAGLTPALGIEHPDVSRARLSGPAGTLVVLTNHSPVEVEVETEDAQTVRVAPHGHAVLPVVDSD
ncbi:cellulase family glycosylhydrolase [Nocardioides sp.]|uniref:glycoside hydrolase 5 family protein n=1 Tax=Nocardioides sp. TaxID=35761 RepID=UPI00352920DF